MKPLKLARLMMRVELVLNRINPLLIAASLMWLVTVIALLWLVPRWQLRLHALNAELLEAQGLLHRRVQPLAPAQAPVEQHNFNTFMNNLGDSRHAEQQLRTLFTIAGDLEIELPEGQYKLACDESGDICRYRVQLPVTGSYALVRAFIEQVLQAIPFASLDELSFKRQSVSDGEVEARLGITLFTRNREGATSTSARGQ